MPLHENYEANLSEAKHFEDFVHDTLLHHKKIVSGMYRSKQYQINYGESATGVEVKLDKSFRLTGNLFIETDERSSVYDEWRPAGIYHHSQPWLFAVGDTVSFWLFATKTLRNVKEHGDFRQVHNSSNTGIGFLLPTGKADFYSAWKYGE